MYGNPEEDYYERIIEDGGLGSYEVHDSGKQSNYTDGMRRDTTDGKPRFDLLFPRDVSYEEQLLTRVAMQYQRGGVKYGDRNWEKSSTEESLAHHEAALMRHVVKFLTGTEDGEDHAAAIVWNVNAVDLTRRNVLKKLEPNEVLKDPAEAINAAGAAIKDFFRDLHAIPVYEEDELDEWAGDEDVYKDWDAGC